MLLIRFKLLSHTHMDKLYKKCNSNIKQKDSYVNTRI